MAPIRKRKPAIVAKVDLTTGKCTHLSCIDSAVVLARIGNPSRWACDECSSNTESVWLCLQCGHTGCGRTCRKMHAKRHFDNTHHPVVLHINQKMPFCYDCDEWVVNDHQRGYIALFREQISRLQNQTFERSTTRNGTEIRSASTRFQFIDPGDSSKSDAGKSGFSAAFTAQRHHQLALLKRSIINWKKLKNLPSGVASTVSTAPSSRIGSPQRGKFAGRTGLRNVGNTCYQNATLMALSSLSTIRELFSQSSLPCNVFKRRSSEEIYVESINAQYSCSKTMKQTSKPSKSDDDSTTVLAQLQKLFRIVWSGKWAGICPAFFVKSFMASSPTFRGYMQHDAHEFYTMLLDSITSCPNDPKPIRQSIVESLTCYQISMTLCNQCHCKSTYEFPGNTCITLDLDAACSSNRSSDEEASKTSSSRPRRSAAMYDIPRDCHLNDCLRVITEPIQLTGNSLYRCESKHCKGSLVSATKRDYFRLLSSCVVFHINRTKWDSKGKRKILHGISFPLKNLDLSCLLSEGSNSPGKYTLKGVVMHHGEGIDQGHYTALCYREEIKSYVAFNDLTSEVIPENDITDGIYEGHPYLLLYERS